QLAMEVLHRVGQQTHEPERLTFRLREGGALVLGWIVEQRDTAFRQRFDLVHGGSPSSERCASTPVSPLRGVRHRERTTERREAMVQHTWDAGERRRTLSVVPLGIDVIRTASRYPRHERAWVMHVQQGGKPRATD